MGLSLVDMRKTRLAPLPLGLLHRAPFLCAALLAALTLLCGGRARAELLRGPYDNPSPVAFEAQLGLQAGLGGYTPGGLHLGLDYTHRFARYREGRYGLWFFGNLSFAIDPSTGVCPSAAGGYYECGALGYGSGLAIKAGLQLTFRTAIPLVPYVRAGVAVTGAFGRNVCEDSGGGFPIAVAGGGARYHFTRHLAAGLHSDLTLGPMFYGAGRQCFPASHVELWRAITLFGSFQYTL